MDVLGGDLVGMATAEGCVGVGFGTIHTSDDVRQELEVLVEQVKAGMVLVVDALVSR